MRDEVVAGGSGYREMMCFKCHGSPEDHYRGSWEDDDSCSSAEDYVRLEEGTYNPDTETYCCDDCYISIGSPSSPQGWIAPAASNE